eukprot:gene10865-12020_t
MKLVAILGLFVLTFVDIYQCKVWKDVGKTLSYRAQPGGTDLHEKQTFAIDSQQELANWPKQDATSNAQSSAFEEAAERVRRASGTPGNPSIQFYHFNDHHYVAEVHWAGKNSSVILMLMRDTVPSKTQPNYFYVSRDYGKTFSNITEKFKLNGTDVVINDYYPSPVNKQHYIITAKFHKVIFVSRDACQSFRTVRVPFTPTKIKFHAKVQNYLLAYDEDHPRNLLYFSYNLGSNWRYKNSYVRSFYWGMKYDSRYTYFVEVRYPGQKSMVRRASIYWSGYTLISNVEDFVFQEKYLFASQKNSTTHGIDVKISRLRLRFKPAIFPDHPTPADSYLFGDASENQLFVAVDRKKVATLYISDESGLKFSESLDNILYYNKDFNPSLPISSSLNKSFIDLYRVQGIYGIYIATQLTNDAPGRRKLKTVITFDKGGEWNNVSVPVYDAAGRRIICDASKGCSLHLSQAFGMYSIYTRFQPMLSKKSAPGLIIAQGSIGTSLRTLPNLYLTADGGVTWKEILQGSWFYKFADHGGIILAIKRYGLVDTLKYSWDDAQSWHTYKFTKTKIRVYGLLTEPGEHTTVFTIFGSYPQEHSWLIVQVDMRDVLGSQCTQNQYKNWTVVSPAKDTFNCLLGKRQMFEKRAPLERCFNGMDYDRPVTMTNCPCTREDFECDVGFRELYGKCVYDPSSGLNPHTRPLRCPPGTFYNQTQGYRKVSGDTCSGGQARQFLPNTSACPLPETSSFIWYARRYSIHRLDLAYPNRDINMRIRNLKVVLAIDFDKKRNTLFWADAAQDKIYRLNLSNASHVEEIKGFVRPTSHVESIAFDWTSGNIYWTDTGLKQIGIVNAYPVKGYDIKFSKVLFTENVDKPRAIALHPKAGYMFWTDWGSSARIERASMDGTNRITIAHTSIVWPNGITVDVNANKIYWSDGRLDKIETADLNGNHRQTVYSYNIQHAYSISNLNGVLYWGDWRRATIESGKANGGSGRRVVKNYVYSVMEIKAFGASTQQGTAPCSSNPCPYICLNKPGGYNCSCPDNMRTIVRNGISRCLCPAGTILESDGECRATNKTCGPTEFMCDNRNCIPQSYKCDFDNDCLDNSDEFDCAYDTCSPRQFKCPSGRCLPTSYLCDGDNDCGDFADEKNCSISCPANMFKCKSRRCIPRKWVCDGDNDCHDNSDEQNCRTTLKPFVCSNGSFACPSDGKCLPKSVICNGVKDCSDNSDEPWNCRCPKGQFHCLSGGVRCVARSKVCNGHPDCTDDSDEEQCATTSKPYSTRCEYRCPSGICISRSRVCDGIPDCPSRADEKSCSNSTATTPAFVCPSQFKCFSEPRCLPMSAKCNGHKDCIDGSDEWSCPTPSGKIDCSFPFGYNCSQDEPCINAIARCDNKPDCVDSNDENPKTCSKASRVSELRSTVEGNNIRLSWREYFSSKKRANIQGYKIIYRSEKHSGEIDPKIYAFQHNYLLTNLRGCSNYRIAVGLKIKGLVPRDWLYSFTSVVTPVNEDLSKPIDLKFVQEQGRHAGFLSWTEPQSCILMSGTKVICKYAKEDIIGSKSFSSKGSFSEIQIEELAEYNCTVEISLRNEHTGQLKTVRSEWYTFKTNAFDGGKVLPHTGKSRSSKSILIWVIPVVLVVLVLVVALVVLVFKYRSLQRSFMAFANRGYNRAEDEDEDMDMAVTFHQGEDAPMINRFSDDDPLVA